MQEGNGKYANNHLTEANYRSTCARDSEEIIAAQSLLLQWQSGSKRMPNWQVNQGSISSMSMYNIQSKRLELLREEADV